MKKILNTVLIFILYLTSTVTVYAAGPQEPTIESEFPDCYCVIGEHIVTLYTDATSPDGGTLEYQWYSTTINDIATIRAIDGATGGTYTPPQKIGVVYYCYAVWNIKSGTRSDPVYSRLIRVEYAESEPTVESIEIVSTPDKVVYAPGECLDLTGLKVRIWTSEGYIDSLNGDKLEITKNPLYTLGEQKIKVAYGDVFDFFIVTVAEKEPEYSIEIQKEPDKLVYTSGECLDLTGLKVRVYTPDGYFDSLNGDKLEITKNPLVTVGYQKIKVAYEDAFEVFIVEVKEAPHTHSFGEWMVTTAPTCTESGIKARECDCGYTERAEIPAAGHQWDAGAVTKEPTEDADGEKTFTCTVCKETRTEVIKAGEIAGEPTADPSASSESTISSGERQPSDPEPSSGFPWWMIIVIVIIAIGIGAAAFIIIQKKK